ncbi:MAG: DsbA family protein [Gammaproteobacteria bacterium]|nr:DsbA family protein [Gammaproteobacteria bacterium]MCP5424000.1 DsbA family protein [Gammaproteobacteria bacterium]
MNTAVTTILYIGDPMCSWCWGFTPVLDRLREQLLPHVGFRLMVGGLRPGKAAVPLDTVFREQLRHHWRAVQERTGQPFAWEGLERRQFIYDTEPAARAVVTVRQLAAELEYAYFRAAQEAFYALGQDTTQLDRLSALAVELGLDGALFRQTFAEESALALTYADFNAARQLGVQGFPTLLLQQGDRYYPLTQGYLPYDRLEPVIRGLLAS